MRFMCIITSEHPAAPPPQFMEAMHDMAQREIKAGRMIADGGLAPLQTGARVSLKKGKVIVLDGPFIEAKEIIGGYAILSVKSKDEAVALSKNFLKVVGGNGTCELHQLYEMPAAGSH